MAGKYHPKYTAEFNGDRLKEIRQKQGLTQEVFAERWGWGESHKPAVGKCKCTDPTAPPRG